MKKQLLIQNIDKSLYGQDYDKHILELYKIYVDSADKISSRRMLANTFFLSIHTALITAFTVLINEGLLPKTLIGMLPFVAVVGLCFVWWFIVESYKQLNSGKFKIIHELEKQLPISLFDSEWNVLGKGNDSSLYRPLSHLERYVPVLFGLMYLLIGISYYFSHK